MDKETKNKLLDIRSHFLDRYEVLLDKAEQLQAENERLKDFLNHSFCDCELNEKYRQALQKIREIIDFRFKTSYMTLGFREYDELIEDIDKIVNEVIGAEG